MPLLELSRPRAPQRFLAGLEFVQLMAQGQARLGALLDEEACRCARSR